MAAEIEIELTLPADATESEQKLANHILTRVGALVSRSYDQGFYEGGQAILLAAIGYFEDMVPETIYMAPQVIEALKGMLLAHGVASSMTEGQMGDFLGIRKAENIGGQ